MPIAGFVLIRMSLNFKLAGQKLAARILRFAKLREVKLCERESGCVRQESIAFRKCDGPPVQLAALGRIGREVGFRLQQYGMVAIPLAKFK